MKREITKQDLDRALEAWQIAQGTAVLEQKAWGTLLQSHSTLIASLRANGHSWDSAQQEFDKLSKGHGEAFTAAWKTMDQRCTEYQQLHAQMQRQAGGKI